MKDYALRHFLKPQLPKAQILRLQAGLLAFPTLRTFPSLFGTVVKMFKAYYPCLRIGRDYSCGDSSGIFGMGQSTGFPFHHVSTEMTEHEPIIVAKL